MNSSETDLVIYTKRLIPPLMFSSDFGYYPIESVLAAIEIKSKLTLQEWRTTRTKFENLHSLKITSGEFDENNQGKPTIVKKVIRSLFAFDSDSKEELGRILENFPNTKNDSFVDSICVVGKGYWRFNGQKWATVNATENYDEVIFFLSSLVNSLNDSLTLRGHPRIGLYLTDIMPRAIN